MKFLLIFVAFLLTPPAWADYSTQAVFTNGTGSPTIKLCDPTSIQSPDVAVSWAPVTGANGRIDSIADHYSLVNGQLTYTYVPPPLPPQPNPTGFLAAVESNSQVQSIFYLLAPFQYSIEQYATNSQGVKLLWNQLCLQYGGQGPLTPTIQEVIQNYGTMYNMPLVDP